MEDGFKKTGQTARDTGNKMKTAGDQGSKAFGTGAVGQLATFAGGFVGISAAISAVTQLLNNMAQTAEEGATKVKESILGAATLQNLAQSPEHFQGMLEEGRLAYASGVGRSRTEAMDLMYQLQASGFDRKDRDLVNEMASVGHTKTNEVLTMVGALKGFGMSFGTKETGSVQDLINKANLSAGSTTTSAAGMLGAIVKSAGSAASLGLSDEELLAFLGVGTAIESDPRLASTKINAFLMKMASKEEFEGKGMSLKEIIETIQGMGMKRAKLEIFTGGIRGIAGYEYIAKSPELMDAYDTMLAEMRTAAQEDKLSEQLELYKHDPNLRRALNATRAAHTEELSTDPLAREKLLYDQVMNEWKVQRREERGTGRWSEADMSLRSGVSGFKAWLFGYRSQLETLRRGDAILDPETRADVDAMLGPEYDIRIPGQKALGLAMPTVAAPAAPAPESIHDFAALAEKFEQATQNLSDAGRDAGRGPTLVPPNVDR